MAQSAIAAALLAKSHELLRAAMYAELCPTIPAATAPQTWDPRELGEAGGNRWPAVLWQDRLWFRDPDDETTDHDEITCIVTLDGSRYLTNDIRFRDAVISRAVTAPPTEDQSPPVVYGDDYLVPEAATGEWADHGDERAMWTARGWRYKPKAIGDVVFVEDEGETGEFVHVNADEEWEDGLPGNLLALAVRPSHLLIRAWAVENQTTASPPATGPAGEQYIISAGTGAWAGHDKKIAWRPSTNADFIIAAPFAGEQVYDKAQGAHFRWNATTGAWESQAGAWVDFSSQFTVSGSTTNQSASHYTPSESTAPTSVQSRVADDVTISYRARRVGATIRLRYQVTFDIATGDRTHPIALFRDSDANAIQWSYGIYRASPSLGFVEFILTATDTNLHTYKMAIYYSSGGSNISNLIRRTFTLEGSA